MCFLYIHRRKFYENSDDMTEGNLMRNGSWTGIFGMLQRREMDIAYMPVTMSSSRMDAMDFTIPAVEMRYCLPCVQVQQSALSYVS
jgi:hypothetical protein